jgi:hypothetical protein
MFMKHIVTAAILTSLVALTFCSSARAGELTVKKLKAGYTISNDFYEVDFTKDAIDRIKFKASGKEIKSRYFFADSIYASAKEIYQVRYMKKEYAVEKIDEKTQILTMSVAFNLKNDKPETWPKAEYEYTFKADSPLIRVHITVTQPTARIWHNMRLNQISVFGTDHFTDWAVAETVRTGSLADTKGTLQPTHWKKPFNWVGVSNDKDALAIITFGGEAPRTMIHIYKPTRFYLNGHYGKLATKKYSRDYGIYIGPSKGGPAAISAVCEKALDE